MTDFDIKLAEQDGWKVEVKESSGRWHIVDYMYQKVRRDGSIEYVACHIVGSELAEWTYKPGNIRNIAREPEPLRTDEGYWKALYHGQLDKHATTKQQLATLKAAVLELNHKVQFSGDSIEKIDAVVAITKLCQPDADGGG